jgi:hypothetical protein
MFRGGFFGGAVLVAIAGSVAGCWGGPGWNHPLKSYTAQDLARRSAVRGYTEVRQGKEIFVAATYAGVKRIKGGKEPMPKVAAIGFGPKGEKVVFEASKDGYVEQALMEEFQRRHGGGEG